MKCLLFIATVLALAAAKPELYKEKEDFQYSRSSSDDGTKAGYYGAQRGNMGGNYEKAHNMDGLAQNQMSGLVRQVEGELGDGSNTRTGSVFTAANSRGVYGSGRYDLTNLQGRNFQEGTSYGDSQSQSSSASHSSDYNAHSSAAHSSGYSKSHAQNSRYTGYQGTNNYQHLAQAGNLQTAENSQGAGAYDYGTHTSHSSGQHSQSSYAQSVYDQNNRNLNSNGYGSNIQTRLVSGAPARVVIRPGSTVYIPVAAQTYDATHSASSFDQNAINSEAEVLSNTNQNTNYRPSSDAKRYESSYSYRKQWEKHDTKPEVLPLAIPTENPIPRNSELYDDVHALRSSGGQYHANALDSQNAHSSNVYSGYNGASSSQSHYQSGRKSHQHHSSSSGANSDAYTQGTSNSGNTADATNLEGDVNSRPKSYQSSYSYHKSWERQGDPYVIEPVSNTLNDEQASQRLTAASNSQYGSHNRHSHQSSHSYSHGEGLDCDENGHVRVARSYNTGQQEFDLYEPRQADATQDDLGQQYTAWESQPDLGQQTHNVWDLHTAGNPKKLEEFGQQSQNQWDNPEDSGQQVQSPWKYPLEEQTRQSSNDNDHSFSEQETQFSSDSLHSFNQHTDTPQKDNTYKAPPNTQSIWDKINLESQSNKENGETMEQQQDNWQKQEDLSQQTQVTWRNLESSNENKRVSNNDKVKPVWEQSEDNTQQVSQNTGSGYSNSWRQALEQTQQSSNTNFQHTQSSYGNQNWNTNGFQQNEWHERYNNTNNFDLTRNYQSNTPRSPTSLQNLWNKLNNFDQVSSMPTSNTEKNETNFSNGYTRSQPKQTSWGQQNHNFESNTDSSESSYLHSYYGSHDDGRYYPWQSNIPSDSTSTSTTTKPKHDSDNPRSLDVGRGDIGPEDSLTPETVTTKKPYSNTVENEIVLSSKPNNKPYKTPEEIEALSLTKEINNTYNFNGANQHTRQINDDQNVNKSGHNIVAVSTNQHRWIEEQRKHGYNQYNNLNNLNSTRSTTMHTTNPQTVEERELKQFGSHSETENNVVYYNKTYNQGVDTKPSKPVSDSQYKPIDKLDISPKNVSLEQGLKELEQQNREQQSEDIDKLHQQSQTTWEQHFQQQSDSQNIENFEQSNKDENSKDLGQQDQISWMPDNKMQQKPDGQLIENFEQSNSEDLGQQVQTSWVLNDNSQQKPDSQQIENFEQSNSEDLGQQVQTSWVPHDNLQQKPDGQQIENFEQSNSEDLGQQVQTSWVPNDNSQQKPNGQQIENFEQSNSEDLGQQVQTSWVPHDNLQQKPDGQQIENFEQSNSEDLGQQVQTSWVPNDNSQQKPNGQQIENFEQSNSEDLGQQVQTSWLPSDNLQQKRDGQQIQNFEQSNSEDLGQQVQASWLPSDNLQQKRDQQIQNFEQSNSEDLGQQVQTSWVPHDNLQQETDARQHEKLGRSNEGQYQKEDFSNQRYNSGNINAPQSSKKVEDIQTAPKSNIKVEKVPEKQEVHSPTESTTEKPGFWKSVGSKLSGAKDKVASWFGS